MAERNKTAAQPNHPLAVTRTELIWEGKFTSTHRSPKTVKVQVK
jgi:hypothetical protein